MAVSRMAALISLFLALVCGPAWAQPQEMSGLWSSEDGQIEMEFFEDGTYALRGAPGITETEVTGRFVIPGAGGKIVLRMNELSRGAAFDLLPTPENLTLVNEELLGGEVTFTRPTTIWLQLGTTPGVLILLTLVFFGGAALLTGQALANGWQPLWKCVPYGLLMGAADRFLNFALFQGPLLSLPGFALDSVIIVALTILGYRVVKARKMTGQYPWLYESKGPFGWRAKAP